MKKLFTIGYEGAALDDFVHTLQSAKIDVLLDVRELPISRRKGFSKTALSNALTVAGIDYRHEKQLGSPRTIRHRLREDGNYPRFFREFDRHLNEQGALLTLLVDELKGNVALMCYERDHEACHRRSVADALADLLGKTPIHLGVDDHARKASKAARPHTRQGVSAAWHQVS
jgi:uncharacterized protein (DUF488 family)